jgi:hypothetical protein
MRLLNQNHLRYKNPHRVPAKADAQAQEFFKSDYEKLKKKCEKEGGAIYFGDCYMLG